MNSEFRIEDYKVWVSPKVMYSLRLDRPLIDSDRKEAKKLSIPTTEFVRRAILEKIDGTKKIKK